jgi:hypothetical protein
MRKLIFCSILLLLFLLIHSLNTFFSLKIIFLISIIGFSFLISSFIYHFLGKVREVKKMIGGLYTPKNGGEPQELSVRSSLAVAVAFCIIIIALLFFDPLWKKSVQIIGYIFELLKFKDRHQLFELFLLGVPFVYLFVRYYDQIEKDSFDKADLKYFPLPASIIISVTNYVMGSASKEVLLLSNYFPICISFLSLFFHGIAFFVGKIQALQPHPKKPRIIAAGEFDKTKLNNSLDIDLSKNKLKGIWFFFYWLSWLFLLWALVDLAVLIAIH